MMTETVMAQRTQHMGASAIREILKVVSRPGMVSLAGGIPAPESFPMRTMRELSGAVLEKYGASACQYDLTEGFWPLREALAAYLNAKGIAATADRLLVGSGSQGILDGLGKILIDPQDRVALEAPTYLGALQAFSPYQPSYVQIPGDDQGMLPDALETALSQGPLKFIYLVPNFQNPSGQTLSMERRQAVAEIIQRHGTLLIEDDPYGDLRYRGKALPALKTLAPRHVVYVSTLSKVLAPGLRIGFCLAPEPVRRWLVLAKQGVDLHTSTFNQALAAEYLSGGHLERHLPTIVDLYRTRQQTMLSAMDRFFPHAYNWSRPDGGMFLWVVGPDGIDMQRVNQKAMQCNTAFVPGTFFFARRGCGIETMRLNYTMADNTVIAHAIRRLGDVLACELETIDV